MDLSLTEQDMSAKAAFHMTRLHSHRNDMAEDKAGCVLDENLSQLNPAELTPLTPEVMHRQATINIGTIGHVAHGKSTLVKALSGVETTRFRKEKERSITIKLGYANAKIYKRVDVEGEGNGPGFFRAFGSSSFLDSRKRVIIPFSSSQPGGPGRVVAGPGSADELCNRGEWELVRHVSFVDCPGHDILMATMLNGAAVMDAATLLVAANEPCPQPQTAEHLAAIEIMQLENVLILQNKVDLVLPAVAHAHFDDIKSFTQGTVAEHAPVIPVSGALQYNVDVVAEYLCCIPVPVRDFTSDPRMMIIRSFDVNKPGQEVADLRGGVAGGSILQGVLRGGQEVEVRPGLVHKAKDGELSCRPLVTRVTSLQAESNALAYAVPGGLIGVGTTLDPTLSRADQLVGHVLGARDRLPPVLSRLEISYYLLRRLLGVKSHGEEPSVAPLGKGEVLMVNVGSTSSGGRVRSLKADLAKLELTTPVCCEAGGKVALSRRVSSSWRLIGWGKIVRGHALHVRDSE